MNQTDFRRLIGAKDAGDEYIPVACLLSTRYGCVGYYNGQLNDGLLDTCVLLNARLVELESHENSRGRVNDFNDFIEDIVATQYRQTEEGALPENDLSQRSIPVTAVPFDQIALVYPVAQITQLLRQSKASDAVNSPGVPSFLDFDNRSIVMRALRTKLW